MADLLMTLWCLYGLNNVSSTNDVGFVLPKNNKRSRHTRLQAGLTTK